MVKPTRFRTKPVAANVGSEIILLEALVAVQIVGLVACWSASSCLKVDRYVYVVVEIEVNERQKLPS